MGARRQGRVLLFDEHRPHGETAAEPLGARQNVGDDPEPLVGVQVPGTSRASLNLVEDEQRADLVAQLPQPLEEAFGGRVHAALALDRLYQDGGGLRTGEPPRGLQVAEGGVDEAAGHGAETLLEGRLPGGGEASVGPAVKGSREGQDLVLVGAVLRLSVLARELYGRLYALRAGVAEEHLVEVRRVGEHPGDLGLQRHLVQVRAVDELLRLLLDGAYQRGVAVAQGARGDAADKVQVTVTLIVEEPATSPARRRDVQAFVRLHYGFQATAPSDMRVPTGSPAMASASASLLFPLRILASTPPRAASAAARSLGTIPPAARPSST